MLHGRWKYFEHEWTAETGSYVFEPPGEIHTLWVPDDVAEMITFFNITGSMVYLDENHRQIGYEDVFTKIDMCRAHYAAMRARGRLCRPVRPLTGAALPVDGTLPRCGS